MALADLEQSLLLFLAQDDCSRSLWQRSILPFRFFPPILSWMFLSLYVLVSAAAQIEIISIVEEAASPAEQPQHTITASFVGIFQSRSRTQDKALVTVGDIIKAGQHVGAIRLLDIPNEVVSSVTGRVVELLVQDGQIVEFGQPLMMIDKQ
jgi:biotin carboxyl carrier protein